MQLKKMVNLLNAKTRKISMQTQQSNQVDVVLVGMMVIEATYLRFGSFLKEANDETLCQQCMFIHLMFNVSVLTKINKSHTDSAPN